MRKHQLISSLIALAIAVSACGAGSAPPGQKSPGSAADRTRYPLELKTRIGPVTLTQRPTRIVSLSATATQMLFAVGAGPQVVAVDQYSTYPSSAPRTKLSGFQPNVEAIARYRPDLVINDADTGNLSRSLRALGVSVLIEPAAKTFEDSYQQIAAIGLATDHRSAAADVVGRMRSAITRLVASVPRPAEPLRIYHELDPTFYSATSGTFIGQIYTLFGLRNIADKAGVAKNSGYPQLSAEYVVSADPQLIVLADTTCCHQSAKTLAARPGWARVDAVRRGLVLGVDDGIASEWGPRIVDYVARVAALVRRAEDVYATAHP